MSDVNTFLKISFLIFKSLYQLIFNKIFNVDTLLFHSTTVKYAVFKKLSYFVDSDNSILDSFSNSFGNSNGIQTTGSASKYQN